MTPMKRCNAHVKNMRKFYKCFQPRIEGGFKSILTGQVYGESRRRYYVNTQTSRKARVYANLTC